MSIIQQNCKTETNPGPGDFSKLCFEGYSQCNANDILNNKNKSVKGFIAVIMVLAYILSVENVKPATV